MELRTVHLCLASLVQPLSLVAVLLLSVANAGLAGPVTADDFRTQFLAALEREDQVAMRELVRENGPLARESVEGLLHVYVESATAGDQLAGRILDVASRLASLYRLASQDTYLEARVSLYAGWGPEQLRRKHQADQLLLAEPGNDLGAAVDRLRAAAEISREIGDVTGTADAVEILGDLHWARRNAQGAREEYQKALSVARGQGNRRGMARLLNKVGNTQTHLRNAVAARDAYREALALARAAAEEQLEGDILGNFGQSTLDLRGDTADALTALREALAIQRRLGNRPGEALTLTGVGTALASQGDYGAAFEHLEAALAIRQALGDAKGMGVTTNNLGTLLVELGRPRQALAKHREAMALLTQAGDDAGVAAALMNLGTAHQELGEYEAAFRYHWEALGKFRALGDRRSEAEVLGNIGNLYHDLGESQRALDHLLEARNVLKTLGDAAGEARQLGNLGVVYERLGKPNEAAAAYVEARALGARAGALDIEGQGLVGLAILAEDRGDIDETERLYREALMLFRRGGRGRGEAHVLANLGFLLVKRGRLDAALAGLEEAARLVAASGDVETQWRAEVRMGVVWQLKGDPEQALAHYVRGIEIVEAIRAGLGRDAVEATRFLEPRWVVYDQPIKLLAGYPEAGIVPPVHPVARYGRTYAEAAFHLAERAKARAFLELLARARGSAFGATLPEDLRQDEAAILGVLARLERELNDPLRAAPGTEQVDALRAARTKLEAFVQKVRRAHPAYAALKYPEPIRVADLPLRSEELLLGYKVTEQRAFLWVVRGDRIVKTLTIPRTREQLREMIRQFRYPLEDPTRLGAFRPDLAEELYQLLLADALEGQDPRRRLVILPDDVLHLLPFEALVVGQRKSTTEAGEPQELAPRYVGEDWEIVYYPSATILAINRHGMAGRSRPPHPLFALGDPVYEVGDPRAPQARDVSGPKAPGGSRIIGAQSAGELIGAMRSAAAARGYGEFRRLRWTSGEVRRVAEVLGVPVAPPAVRLGLTATKTALVQSDLTRYQYLHFATHGILAGDLPYLREPALVLSLVGLAKPQDGFLTMGDVFDLKLNADLAVLSACQTALGESIAGEGIVGLSRAFLYAGASSVLVSLWPVNDQSTALFMERFYFHLTKGKLGRAEALRRARQDLRQGFIAADGTRSAGRPHPFFWAPFVLIGEPD